MIQLMVLHWGTVSIEVSLVGERPKRGKICRPKRTGVVRDKISGGGPA